MVRESLLLCSQHPVTGYCTQNPVLAFPRNLFKIRVFFHLYVDILVVSSLHIFELKFVYVYFSCLGCPSHAPPSHSL
jgi:hypothetical protein